jgi:vacuolar protein 8
MVGVFKALVNIIIITRVCHDRLRLADDNKSKIAKSGALVPLTRLARSKDMRVQRNATGALLNMTHSGNS